MIPLLPGEQQPRNHGHRPRLGEDREKPKRSEQTNDWRRVQQKGKSSINITFQSRAGLITSVTELDQIGRAHV